MLILKNLETGLELVFRNVEKDKFDIPLVVFFSLYNLTLFCRIFKN